MPRSLCRSILFLSAFVFVVVAFNVAAFAGDDWLPVNKEDLQMKEYPQAPGVHAIILYHSIDRNDSQFWERQYYRIKILDEEGKKYANIELEAYANTHSVRDIKARTINPDGTIIPFTGTVFEKKAKFKDVNAVSKTFSLPNVQVGSIIEYRYSVSWGAWIIDSKWLVQDYLFTREGVFTLTPYLEGYTVSWVGYFLPPNEKTKDEHGKISLKVHNLSAFERETFMPPEDEVRARVEFTYSADTLGKNADEYWKKEAKDWYSLAEKYMNKKKEAEREVATLVSPSDAPEVKLRKLYDRVKRLRNLTYEESKSGKEAERENLRDNYDIDDVLKHGYSYHNGLIRTFTALARAAGFDATIVRVQERDRGFFHKSVRRFDRLDTEIAVVKLNGTEMYLDPGVPFCPFGMLSWEDTGVQGLMLNKEDAKWIKTPLPGPEESVQQRVAELTLDREGTLTGEVKVRFSGQEALRRRLNARNDDDAERKKDLEKEFKDSLPSTATVELGKIDDWKATSENFDVTAKITIPGFASATGKRLMLPVSVFAGSDAHPFTHAKRIHPVYIRSAYTEVDQVRIKIPEGLQVETVPNPTTVPTEFADFTMKTSNDKDSISIVRQVTMAGTFFSLEHYPALRSFFDKIKAVGDEQAILRTVAK
jgi:hypothetical protein